MKVPLLFLRNLSITGLVFFSSITSQSVLAADWLCSGTESWGNSNCWSGNMVPGVGQTARIRVSSSTDVVVNYSGNVNAGVTLPSFFLNNSSSGMAILNRYGTESLNASLAVIGLAGNAVVNHSGGDSLFTNAVIGSQLGSNAIYNLSNTATITANGFTVGNAGSGELVQTGGHLTVIDTLSLGQEAGGFGDYKLITGNLDVLGTEYVGYFGDAQFTQSGGTHNVRNLHVGRKSASGNYTMEGGTLNVSGIMEVGTIPGAPGNTTQHAMFEQNGGDVNLTAYNGQLTISASGMANGRYDLNAGSLTVASLYNNDLFKFMGGSLTANIENRDSMVIGGSGTRVVNGNLTNIGEAQFQHTYNYGTVNQYDVTRTSHGVLELVDATLVEVQGDLVLEDGGTLDIDLASGYLLNNVNQPWITVLGSASIGGNLDLSGIINSILLNDGDSWTLLLANEVYGSFDNVIYPQLDSSNWLLSYGHNNIMLSYSAVPLPAAAWLFASGLLGLIVIARRTQK